MGKIFLYLPVFIVFLSFAGCSNDSHDYSPELNNGEISTRKVFASFADFQNFIKTIEKDETKTFNIDFENGDIVEIYKELTNFKFLYNAENEFQISNTVYKLGLSGYTEYKIESDVYHDAIELIKNEEEIINNIKSYKMITDNVYEIIPGVSMAYSGKPIIEITDIQDTPIKTRTNVAHDTKVTVRFWVSHATYTTSCGIRVDAVRESTGKALVTELNLNWQNVNIRVALPGSGSHDESIMNGNHNKQNSSSFEIQYYSESASFGGSLVITLLSGTLQGGAKAPNGNWVYATINR